MDDAELARAGAAYQRAQAARDTARAALDPVVADAVRRGIPQARIVELTGLTRETVRVITRRAGYDRGYRPPS